MADESTNTIRVIVCRPDERAEIVEIEDKLEAMRWEEVITEVSEAQREVALLLAMLI